jgi:hypothetical protein
MKAIPEVADQPLRWTRPALLKREYELRAWDDVVATLRWQKTFGSLALAETADGTWTFKRSGFLPRPIDDRMIRIALHGPANDPAVQRRVGRYRLAFSGSSGNERKPGYRRRLLDARVRKLRSGEFFHLIQDDQSMLSFVIERWRQSED